MRARIAIVASAAACVLAAVPAPASAVSPDDEYEALAQVTRATGAAVAAGADVIQTVHYGARSSLADETPRVAATVRAGTRVRIHSTVGGDGSGYVSVRYQPSGRLIAAAGIDPATSSPWATLRMLHPGDRAAARAAGLADRTALTGVPVDSVLDRWSVTNPAGVATGHLLPPYAASYDEGWTTITMTPQPDGTTVFAGSIRGSVPASDGEDTCARPLVEVTVGPDRVARSSRWIEKCPGQGTRIYETTAAYGPQDVQPPTRPRRPASTVLD